MIHSIVCKERNWQETDIFNAMSSVDGLVETCTDDRRPKNIMAQWRGDGKTISDNVVIILQQSKDGPILTSSDMSSTLMIMAGQNPWDHRDMPIIQVDDSGWGCPVGGVLIGAMGPDNVVNIKTLGPEVFRARRFRVYSIDVAYETIALIESTLSTLSIPRHAAIIEICTSPILGETRELLHTQGANIRAGRIEGRLQQELRVASQKHLIDLGVPPEIVGKNFHIIRRWAESNLAKDVMKWKVK